jgi:predicted ATPase
MLYKYENSTDHRYFKINYLSILSVPDEGYSRTYLRQCKLYHFHDTSDTAKFKSFQEINANGFLWSDAGNLAPFLLKLKKDFQGDYQNIVQAVQTVAPYFHDFDLKKDENEVILRWHHKNDLEGSGFSAQTLSITLKVFFQSQ